MRREKENKLVDSSRCVCVCAYQKKSLRNNRIEKLFTSL